MKIMRMKVAVAIGMISLASVVNAESISGSEILEQEATRAKELQDLKYQAQLLEQRAKIAKAYQELNGAGGYIPPSFEGQSGTVEVDNTGGKTSIDVKPQGKIDKKFKMPVLKKINGNVASFETKQGYAEAKEGGFLPGGFRVLTVSSLEGVKMMRKGIIYQVGFSWEND